MYETEEQRFLYRREPAFAIDVERPQAASVHGTSFFRAPTTDDPGRHGTFDNVIRRLPAIRDMGFDVLYLPPIHPIGITNRKGKNNSLDVRLTTSAALTRSAAPKAATMRSILRSARSRIFGGCAMPPLREGLEIALDFAIQCSPDHPWLRDHPGMVQLAT